MTRSTDSSTPDASSVSSRGRFPGKRVWVLLAIGVLLLILHPPILTWMFSLMVVDESADDCRYGILISRSDECYDKVAQLLNDGTVEKFFLLSQEPRRTVELDIAPDFGELAEIELSARGIESKQYATVDTEAPTLHQMFRDSDSIFRAEGDDVYLVVCPSTHTRKTRMIVDQALPADRASHYRVQSIPMRKAPASGWWRSRRGVASVMINGLRLIYVACRGESDVDSSDPYEYLVQQAAKA